MSVDPAARTLARWALRLTLDAVPIQAQHAAVRHLLDGVGCAIAGFTSGAGSAALAVAAGLGGPAESTVIGLPGRTGAASAALANGTLVHAVDFDDTHAGGLVHATAMVLPAALAVGEQADADGATLLTAAVAGYEIACRLPAVVPNAFHARGLHPTAACGVFSAALVASKLMGLSEDRTVDALGIAGSMAGGLLEFLATGSSTKQLHPGFAAHSGVLAARLAAAGASGPESVLDGRYGLYAAFLDRRVTADQLTAGLGSDWQVQQITIKPYPACQLMHATLDATATAAVAAGSRGGWVDPAQVRAVVVDVHPDSATIVCEPAEDKLNPKSPYDAKFSLPWSVSALLIDGALGSATYTPDAIRRPEVADLARRVQVRVVPIDGVAAAAPGRVELRLTDGHAITGEISSSTGGPGNPMGDPELDAKFRLNCPPGAAQETTALNAQIRRLAAAPSIRDLATQISEVAAAGPTVRPGAPRTGPPEGLESIHQQREHA